MSPDEASVQRLKEVAKCNLFEERGTQEGYHLGRYVHLLAPEAV